MVRYDFQCDTCDWVMEVVRESGDTHTIPCSRLRQETDPWCFGTMSWKPTVQSTRDWLSEANPVWHEHLDNTPVKLTSKEQYRAELKKRGLRHRDFNHGENLTEV